MVGTVVQIGGVCGAVWTGPGPVCGAARGCPVLRARGGVLLGLGAPCRRAERRPVRREATARRVARRERRLPYSLSVGYFLSNSRITVQLRGNASYHAQISVLSLSGHPLFHSRYKKAVGSGPDLVMRSRNPCVTAAHPRPPCSQLVLYLWQQSLAPPRVEVVPARP